MCQEQEPLVLEINGKQKKKSKVCLANTPTQDGEKNKKKYRKLQRPQTGKGLAGNLSNLGISMGSKAIN